MKGEEVNESYLTRAFFFCSFFTHTYSFLGRPHDPQNKTNTRTMACTTTRAEIPGKELNFALKSTALREKQWESDGVKKRYHPFTLLCSCSEDGHENGKMGKKRNPLFFRSFRKKI